MSRHLDLIQQYGGTNGYCHLWALGIREVLPEGRIVVLLAKDPRTFKAHDWPEEERLELHQFVLLPDGRAVDAQGAHDVTEMTGKFGIKRGYSFEILPVEGERQDMDALAKSRPEWHETAMLYSRVIASIGWADELPPYDGELERNWKSVDAAARREGVPDPAEPKSLAP